METASKDKVSIKVVEYETRSIDEFGDASEVFHFETREEAILCAKRMVEHGEEVAAVVEKHTRKYPSFLHKDPSVYKTIAVFGDPQALELGKWDVDC